MYSSILVELEKRIFLYIYRKIVIIYKSIVFVVFRISIKKNSYIL